jgi:3-phenylpropionate/cinnamic acid dioxygenase small subunit|tara:strand:+ start:1086 stop:1301 length:216 start_codon:yes stop_codon:yes gene_type:complete
MTDLPKWAKPARWMKNAVATNRGWVNEKTGELYKTKSMLKDRIAALNVDSAPAPKPAAATKKKVAKKKSDD